MKRFITIFLTLICLMAYCCPAFAAVECTVPQDLPGVLSENLAVHDVLILGGGEGETTPPQEPVADVPADGVFDEQPVDGKYSTMGALYQAWGGWEGYPDYVCGVWSTDGGMDNLTVAVTDDKAGEQGREAILAQLRDHSSVTFTTQTYSYRQLQQVMDEIVTRMGGDSPIVACGIYEMDNNVHVTINEGHEQAQEIALELSQRYADRVEVELGDLVFSTTREELGKENPATDLLPFALLMMAVLTGLLLVKKLPARVTNTGKVVTGDRLTKNQVEAAVRESRETPPDRVEDRIREQL